MSWWPNHVGEWMVAAAPFVGQTRNGGSGDNDDPPRFAPDVRRIVETLIPAAVVGIIVLWGSVQVIGSEMAACKERVRRIEAIVERIHMDIYKPRWDVPGPPPIGMYHRYPDYEDLWVYAPDDLMRAAVQ